MNALIARLRTPRPFWAHVVRLVAVRTVATLLIVATVLFGQSMALQPSGAELESSPGTSPAWSAIDRAAYPDCVAADDWPPNTWGSSVVAYSPVEGTTSRIGFDEAWERTHNTAEGDDLTVLGICR